METVGVKGLSGN